LSGLAGGIGVGALAMFLFDPGRGRMRRAHVRDKVHHLRRLSSVTVEATRVDISNRARGLVAELRGRLSREPIDDEILVERVRSQIGRLVTHPHALEISAHDGIITLRGRILAEELHLVLTRLKHLRGVHGVENLLVVHGEPGHAPDLQGAGRPHEPINEWPPTMRAAALASGGLLVLRGLIGRGLFGLGLGGLGMMLLLRGLTNQPIGRYVERTLEPRLHLGEPERPPIRRTDVH
jgi:hypothetical protein